MFASEKITFGFAQASILAGELITRQSRESMEAYLQRRDEASCKLLTASVEQGTPLHRYLTRGHVFTPAEQRPKALHDACAETLCIEVVAAPSGLALEPLHAAAARTQRPELRLA